MIKKVVGDVVYQLVAGGSCEDCVGGVNNTKDGLSLCRKLGYVCMEEGNGNWEEEPSHTMEDYVNHMNDLQEQLKSVRTNFKKTEERLLDEIWETRSKMVSKGEEYEKH